MSTFKIDPKWEDFIKALKKRQAWWRDEAKGQYVPHPDNADVIDQIRVDKPASVRDMLDRKEVAAEWADPSPKWHKMYATLQLEYNLMGRAARDLLGRYRTWTFAQIHQASRFDHSQDEEGQVQIHLIKQLTEMAPKDTPNG